MVLQTRALPCLLYGFEEDITVKSLRIDTKEIQEGELPHEESSILEASMEDHIGIT